MRGGYGGSNIPHFRYCGPSHSIANPFLSLTSHIQTIWTKTSQIQQKLCYLCILFVLNHISRSVVISTIFAGRIEFSSDGKGIDWQFLRFDYLYVSRAQEHILNHLRPYVFGQGGGGAYYVTSHQARNHNHQASSIRKQQLLRVILL